MSGIDLYSIQQDIKQYVSGNINWYVTSGGVPDAQTLVYVNGSIDPYVVLRFSRMMPTSRGGSFGGAIYDEYYSYVDALCIAATDDEANELASRVERLLIGKKFDNTGEVKPNFGGGTFTISLDSQHPLAYIAVSAFRFSLNQIAGEGSLIPS